MHRGPPFVDDEGRVHHRGRVVPLDPAEARIATALTTHLGAVVTDQELLDALGGAISQPASSLRAEISRLRARLRTAQLTISRTRRRGYVMTASPEQDRS